MPHQPKGGMCAACQHRLRNCSALPFDQMKVIQKYPDGTKVVRCDKFKRREA